MKRTTILIADDHSVVVEGLRRILDRPELEIVGALSDGGDVLESAQALRPDILLIDVTMPGMNGLEVARRLRDERLKIIILTMHDEALFATRAFDAGVSGYILKSSAGEELLPAIGQVLDGGIFISSSIVERVKRAREHRSKGSKTLIDGLTPRKRQILQMLAEGQTVKEIAGLLHISTRTVEFHKYGLMRAIGARTAVDLARYAVRHGVV